MDILRWNELLISYPKACTALYFWALKKRHIEGYKVDQPTLINTLNGNGLLGNEEKIFVFLDEKTILCGVYPLGHKRFRCFAQSEHKAFICNDQPSREVCTEMIITNGLYLLEERLIE